MNKRCVGRKIEKPFKSTRKGKKKTVCVKKGEDIIAVDYGAVGYRHNYSKAAKKSFRARHRCDSKKDKTTAGYWACEDLWPVKNNPVFLNEDGSLDGEVSYRMNPVGFKDVRKYFLSEGIDKERVDDILKRFKKLRDERKLPLEERNIGDWIARGFDDLVLYVEQKELFKTDRKIAKEGASKVAENDEWLVYKIDTHKACMLYGAETKWCITSKYGREWSKYYNKNNFYFILRKKPLGDEWDKIAVRVAVNGEVEFWNSLNEDYRNLPGELRTPKFKMEAPEARIDIDGKIYSVSEFEKLSSLKVIRSLNLEDIPITSLPSDLKVGGSLILRGTKITSLPSGLKVGGYIDLTGTPITSLPSDLKVGMSLFLRGTKITSLPSGLKVGGVLDLAGTPITSLPSDLKVGGYLDLQGTKITSLPSGLKVGGVLDLAGTPITSLPSDLKVGGYLDLQGTNITSLPSDLKVGGSLDLRNTRIASLPANLKVGRNLDLRGTRIASLPTDLKVGKSLDLENTKITSLPAGLEVGWNLILIETPLAKRWDDSMRPKGVKGKVIL